MFGVEFLVDIGGDKCYWGPVTKQELQKKIAVVVRQIVEKCQPEMIILFGSAVWGRHSCDSDIDFLIIKKDVPEDGLKRQYLFDKMIERNGIALDMLIYRPDEVKERLKLGDPFMKEIVNKGKVLYGRQKDLR